MSIVGGFDVHRKQLTFDYVDRATGELQRGQVAPADRRHLAVWLRRFDGVFDVEFAVEGCTGWRYVTEEIAAAGWEAHVAEPADTQAARGRKHHAKTDRTDARLLRELLAAGELPEAVCLALKARLREYAMQNAKGSARRKRFRRAAWQRSGGEPKEGRGRSP